MYTPQHLSMSDVFFILGRAAVYLTAPDTLRGVLLASKEVQTEVLAHVEVVEFEDASEAAIATVFACRQLTTLKLLYCYSLAALPDRIGDCAALTTLKLSDCYNLTALTERLGECAALTSLDLTNCHSLIALPERLGDCAALTTLNLSHCRGLAALPERLGECAALTTLNLRHCRGLAALPERLGDCAALMTLNLRHCPRLPSHLDVVERLTAHGCEVLLGAQVYFGDEENY